VAAGAGAVTGAGAAAGLRVAADAGVVAGAGVVGVTPGVCGAGPGGEAVARGALGAPPPMSA
jgi:hypothetical protein